MRILPGTMASWARSMLCKNKYRSLFATIFNQANRPCNHCVSTHLRYAINDGVKRFPDEAECGQIEKHVEHETTRARVCMCAANHHVPLRVHVTKLDMQFAQYLWQKKLRLISRDNVLATKAHTLEKRKSCVYLCNEMRKKIYNFWFLHYTICVDNGKQIELIYPRYTYMLPSNTWNKNCKTNIQFLYSMLYETNVLEKWNLST